MQKVRKVLVYTTSISIALSAASMSVSADNSPVMMSASSITEKAAMEYVVGFEGPVTSNQKIDPTSVFLSPEGMSTDSKYILKNSSGVTVSEANLDFVPVGTLEGLANDTYTIEFMFNDFDGNPKTVKDTFRVVQVVVTTHLDKPVNPKRIWGTSSIDEVSMSWAITDKQGNPIKNNVGSEVPANIINGLPVGKYEIKFSGRLENTNKTHFEIKEFEIVKTTEEEPDVSVFLDRTTNPKSITGDKKLVDSKLEWTINEGAKVLHTGEGKTVTQSLVDALPAGTYQVSFKEISKTGKESVKTETFKMRFPNPTVTVDKAENPTKIEATPAIAESSLKWVIKSGTTEVKSGTGSIITEDLKGLADGSYTVVFTERSPEDLTKDAQKEFTVKAPVELPQAVILVDRPINPRSITGDKKLVDSKLEWTIKNGAQVLHTGEGKTVTQSLVDALSAGTYQVSFKETTVKGLESEVSETITMRYPNPTVTVDKAENPTKIEATPAIAESSLKWVIKSGTTEVKSGTGSIITEDLKGLADGSYTVVFTERSPEDLTKDAQKEFTVKAPVELPQAVILVDRPINPRSITGDKKLVDSKLEWTIKNGAQVLHTGEGKTVTQSLVDALSAGTYQVSFKETTVKGLESEVSETITMRYPNPTVTVDKAENPTKIEATPAIAESTLKWVITSATGDIKSGTGSVIVEDLQGLADGTYTVTFTETSPEGLTKDANATFTTKTDVVLPEVGMTIDRYYNPTSITGSKKLSDSTLEWTIGYGLTTVHTGTGAAIPQDILEGLDAGRYFVTYVERSATGETSRKLDEFEVRYPNPTVTVDKAENPTKIEATPAIAESTLKWVITSATGDIKSGAGSVIVEDLQGLDDGTYTVTFTETSPEGLTKDGSINITIKKDPVLVPQAQISVDRPINPRSITGDKKLVDSKLEWAISDATAILHTGEGKIVTQSLIDTLPSGVYEVSFTETSVTGLVSKVSSTITMRYPNPVISVDKAVNPTKIEATPAITESAMKWIITSATGDIKSGTGLVIDGALNNLEAGTYTVVFTETSPEGLEKSASATFDVKVTTGETDNGTGTVDGGEKLPATGINNSIAQLGLFISFMGVIALLLEKMRRRV
ncbi:hypothetical protein [Erysipelothrix anatis]|uniref:hypothetical protein n=2 Tax=Erysipelothrix anatis TaxID=2683713 RepID=UPI00140B19EB|nr:hypothetical protein [Erysipelothrix anatis]